MAESRSDLNRAWLAVPILTLGFGSFAPFLFQAARGGGRRSWLAVGAYAVLALAAGLVIAGAPAHSARSTTGGFLLIASMIAGTAHVAAIRRQPVVSQADPLTVARHNAELRRHAREVVEQTPHLAVEAGIGRPDLPQHYDDGGLIDVNRVPATVLALLPGINAPLAKRIVDTRASVGGFSSLSDLCVTLDLVPQSLDDVEDRLAFIPL